MNTIRPGFIKFPSSGPRSCPAAVSSAYRHHPPFVIRLLLALFGIQPAVVAADATWNLDAGGSWTTAANWTPTAAPGQQNSNGLNPDTATFGGIITADRAISGLNNTGIKDLLFNASYRYTFGSGGFRLTDGGKAEIQSGATGSVTINTNVTLFGNYSILANGDSSSLFTTSGNLSGNSNFGTLAVTLGGASGTQTAPNVLGNTISNGTGNTLGIVKEGSSVWAIGSNGNNTFTGGVLIKAGMLIAQGQNSALGASSATVTLGSEAVGQDTTLHIGNSRIIPNSLEVAPGEGLRTLSFSSTSGGNAGYSGTITLSKAVAISHSGSQSFAISGATTGTGNMSLENSSTGNLTVSGSLNPTGAISHIGTGTGTLTISGAIGENVTSLTQNSASTTVLNTANQYGQSHVLQGTLRTGTLGTFGTGSITAGGADVPAILTLGNPASINDTATVSFDANVLINLSFNTGVERIGVLRHSATTQSIPNGTYNAAQLNEYFQTSLFSGSGSLEITASDTEPAHPYDSWTVSSGLDGINGRDPAPDADPDHDGLSNHLEFALNGNPLASAPLTHVRTLSISGISYLTLTTAIRDGASFSGLNAKVSAPVDGLVYTIQGSTELSTWDTVVIEAVGAEISALHESLPSPSTGWTYRTFRPSASLTQAPRVFLRAKVE